MSGRGGTSEPKASAGSAGSAPLAGSAGEHTSLFERFDIDPRLGPRAITERLRELAEEAGEAERAELREAWEELTLHPMRRLRAAFVAHPESRPPLGAPPPLPRESAAVDPHLTLSELSVRPSVARALGGGGGSAERPEVSPQAARSPSAAQALGVSGLGIGILIQPPLEDDPILLKKSP